MESRTFLMNVSGPKADRRRSSASTAAGRPRRRPFKQLPGTLLTSVISALPPSFRWEHSRRNRYHICPPWRACWTPVVSVTCWSAITNNTLAWRTSSVASIRRNSGTVSGSSGGNTRAGSNFPITTAAAVGVGVILPPYHPKPAASLRPQLPTALAHAIPYGSDLVVDVTCRNVAQCDIRHARRTCLAALARQPRGEPVSPSWLIPVDLLKSERLEPRRGPRAHISLVVVAVDDHRPRGVELPHRLAAKDLQRNVDRCRNMLGFVFLSGQHIDELRAVSEKLAKPIPIDLHHHGDTSTITFDVARSLD